MNKYDEILKELVEILRSHIAPVDISIPAVMMFLLGEKVEARDGQVLNFSCNTSKSVSEEIPESTLYAVYSGTRDLPLELLPYVAASNDYSFTRLSLIAPALNFSDSDKEALRSAALALYDKYVPDNTMPLSFSQMVKILVSLYFFNTEDVGLCFPPYVKRVCIDNYIPLTDKKYELERLLSSDTFVFVTGLPGSGKKNFVKDFISGSNYNQHDIGWIDAQTDSPRLSQCIKRVQFILNDGILSEEDILDNLSLKNNTAILIIELPYLVQDDYDYIESKLHSLDLPIIIITRTIEIPGRYSVLNIDNCSELILNEIFTSIYPQKLFSPQEFSSLCEIVSYNPLVLTLLAKSLIKIKTNSLIKDKLLDKKEWLWTEKGLPTIHSLYRDPGTKSGLSAITLTYRLIADYPSKFSCEDTLSRLSLWAKYEVSKEVLKNAFTIKDLNLAIQYGILQYCDTAKSNLIMPALIADTIWSKFPIDYADYEKRIRSSLKSIQIGRTRSVPYTVLYAVTLNMIYRFHYNIITLESRPNKQARQRFQSWNILLMELIMHFNTVGNTELASCLLNELYISRNLHKQLKNSQLHSSQKTLSILLQNIVQLQQTDNDIYLYNQIISELKDFTVTKRDIKHHRKEYYLLTIVCNTLKITLVDIYLEIEHNSTLDCLTNHEYPQSNAYVRLLLQMIEQILKSESLDENYYNYYSMISTYIQAIYQPQYRFEQIMIANKYFYYTFSDSVFNSELNFKAALQKFYYELLLNYIHIVFDKGTIPPSIYECFAFTYYRLCDYYSAKIHSKATAELFYKASLLYKVLLALLSRVAGMPKYLVTYHRISKVLSTFSDFTLEQLSLPSEISTEVIHLLKEVSLPYNSILEL